MTCVEFDHWLDEGEPAAFESVARDHVRVCTRCAAELLVSREMESEFVAWFTSSATSAPPGFTGRVMARLALSPRRAVTSALPPAMDWWVRAAADPAAALALVLAGLLAWRGDAIARSTMALAQAALSNAASWLGRVPLVAPPALPRFATPLVNPTIVLALALATAPAVLWASWRLFAWAERACLPVRRPLSQG